MDKKLMNKKKEKSIPIPTKLTRQSIPKIKSVSSTHQKIIDENITRWEEENADRLSLEKEINSLSEGKKKLIKRLRKAEKTDPKKPILRASADYDNTTNTVINYKENIGV